jgi:hypothetical protein
MSEQCAVSEQRAAPVDVLGQEIHDIEEQVRDLRQQAKDSESEVKDGEAPTPGAAKSNKRHREAQDAQAEEAQAQEAEPKRQQTSTTAKRATAKRDIWDALERVCVETQFKCSKSEVEHLVSRAMFHALPVAMKQVERKWVSLVTDIHTEQRKHFYEVFAETRATGATVEERLTSIERKLEMFEVKIDALDKFMKAPKEQGNDVLQGLLGQEGETLIDFSDFGSFCHES